MPLSHVGDTSIEASPGGQPVQADAAGPGSTVMLDNGSMANQTAQPSHVHDEVEAADDTGTMPLVEAAALGASSPGAVVRVPTTTTLSQADQIALRYQHQASKLSCLWPAATWRMWHNCGAPSLVFSPFPLLSFLPRNEFICIQFCPVVTPVHSSRLSCRETDSSRC